jgi:hypothetical protein
MLPPFQGLNRCCVFTQGVALGWYVAALSGLKKPPFLECSLWSELQNIKLS